MTERDQRGDTERSLPGDDGAGSDAGPEQRPVPDDEFETLLKRNRERWSDLLGRLA